VGIIGYVNVPFKLRLKTEKTIVSLFFKKKRTPFLKLAYDLPFFGLLYLERESNLSAFQAGPHDLAITGF